ncbi:hypothetical protein [Streptomyces sp. NPDC006274]|uniref:hypothetical protein n=1 Tax=unclassified Streptomyces TaxID=2593676 RepID=UPI0033AC85D1
MLSPFACGHLIHELPPDLVFGGCRPCPWRSICSAAAGTRRLQTRGGAATQEARGSCATQETSLLRAFLHGPPSGVAHQHTGSDDLPAGGDEPAP